MAMFRCKSCGGELDVKEGVSVVECEYCNNKQTLPKVTDENLQALFNRANFLRQKCDFDKAEKLYEKILEQDEKEAEAYWGVILCKFGIEYVKDPGTDNMIPTCHRASYESIVADEYYKQAIKYADAIQRPVYEADAKKIDLIQKQILDISRKEKPYDVFICYKETGENGQRTHDSVMANDIYYQLTQEGFKVFYAAITLEGKLGSDYEAIIFAALNSAKVMLVVGSKPEYFQATWVRNEWSRYLQIMKKDRSKLLIPCYSGMDAYDLPEEFAHLQAQDMSKIGFINDLVRGIKKVVVKEEPKAAPAASAVTSTTAPLIKRALMFLEDGDFSRADELCEQVLNQDPENAMAYVCKLMSALNVRRVNDLANLSMPFDEEPNYKKAIRFGDKELKERLAGYNDAIKNKNATAKQQQIYAEANTLAINHGGNPENLKRAASLFALISNYKDSAERAKECAESANSLTYDNAYNIMKNSKEAHKYLEAKDLFSSIKGYKDADALANQCDILAKDADYASAIANMNKCRNSNEFHTAAQIFDSLNGYKDSASKADECRRLASDSLYNEAISAMNRVKTAAEFNQTAKLFDSLKGYKDSSDKAAECRRLAKLADKEETYQEAVSLMSGFYSISTLDDAIKKFGTIESYKDSKQRIDQCYRLRLEMQKSIAKATKKKKLKKMVSVLAVLAVIAGIIGGIVLLAYNSGAEERNIYNEAVSLIESGEYESAIAKLEKLDTYYKDVSNLLYNAKVELVVQRFDKGDIEGAEALWEEVRNDYYLSSEYTSKMTYHQAGAYANIKDYIRAKSLYNSISEYSDSKKKLEALTGDVYDYIYVLVDEGKYQEAYNLTQAFEFSVDDISEETRNIWRCLGANDFKGAVNYGLTEIVIPEGITELSNYAFSNCEGLISVTLPDTVTIIGESAFDNCANLTTVNIPDSVTEIGRYAFRSCPSLTTIDLPDSITTIPRYAFQNCYALENINIPESVTVIDEGAFYGCTNLSDITLPSGLTTINPHTFQDCTALTNITFPASVQAIESEAFRGCTGLTNVVIPDTITRVASGVFRDCTSMVSITVPFIGENADASGRLSMAHIFYEMPASVKFITVTGGTSVPDSAFKNLGSIVTVSLPDTVTSIGNEAFYGCTNLASVKTPAKLKTIGAKAFTNCYSLISIIIPQTTTGIGDKAFENCYKLVEVYNLSATMTMIQGDDSQGFIAKYAKAIHTSAHEASILFNVEDYVFINISESTMPSLLAYMGAETELTLPTLATEEIPYYNIADYAFYYNSSIKKVTFSSEIVKVGKNAFNHCTSLEEVDMSSACVATIDTCGFYDCDSLTTVTFSDNLTTIFDEAFYSCKMLKEVYFPGTLNHIGKKVFGDTDLTEAAFASVTGWWYTSDPEATSGTEIDPTQLTNSMSASSLLDNSFCYYYWNRT